MRTVSLIAALAAVLVSAVTWAAETSGPDKGSAPMLMIKPFNQDGDAYCVTCQAGLDPLVVAFVTKNDEAAQKLLSALAEEAKSAADRHLHADIVVLGGGTEADALTAWIKDQKLPVAAACVAADDKSLEPWKINGQVANTVVLFKGHKVEASFADLAAGDLAGQVKTIVGDGGGGGGMPGMPGM